MALSSPKTSSAARSPAEADPLSLPMAAAALLTSLAGLHAVYLVFFDPAFTALVVSLTVVGSASSYLARRCRLSPNPLEWPAIALFGLIGFMVFTSNQPLPVISPRGATDIQVSHLALALAWLIVGLSFAGSYNVRLLFTAVPSLAAIGLVSTMSADPMVASLFLTYIFATTFMVVHERCLRAASAAVAQGRSPGPSLLLGQLQTVIVCTLGAALVGSWLARPMQVVGSQVIGNAIPITVPAAGGGLDRPRPTSLLYSNSSVVPLGTGPVTLSSRVVLRVRAEHGAYWRSGTFDRYGGNTWGHSSVGAYAILRRPAEPGYGGRWGGRPGRRMMTMPDLGTNAVGGPSHRLHQTVSLEGAGQFGEIVGASEPRTIEIAEESVDDARSMTFATDRAGSILISPPARRLVYNVDSQVADSTPEQLRQCGTEYPDDVRELYLTPGVSEAGALERIRQAATAATRSSRNNYDRVQALARFVSSTCAYNTNAKAVPFGRDVVAYFLFESREGYCDSFASSLAILCRSIGIPARVASGFVPGQRDADTGWYVVRDRDRHMWTEVYFAGVGWLPFDATTDAVDKSPQQKNDAEKKPSLGDLLFRRGWLPPLALAAFILMLGYVLKVEVLDRILARRRGQSWSSLPPTNERIARSYLAACELLARHGAHRAPDQTPLEFAQAAMAQLGHVPEAGPPLQQLTEQVTRYCYSGEVATPAEVAEAATHHQALQTALRRAPSKHTSARPAPDTA